MNLVRVADADFRWGIVDARAAQALGQRLNHHAAKEAQVQSMEEDNEAAPPGAASQQAAPAFWMTPVLKLLARLTGGAFCVPLPDSTAPDAALPGVKAAVGVQAASVAAASALAAPAPAASALAASALAAPADGGAAGVITSGAGLAQATGGVINAPVSRAF